MSKLLKTVHLAADHAGFKLKETIKQNLIRAGYEVIDHGTNSTRSSDYPDYIIPAAEAVAASRGQDRGIVFGGSGIGECIAANKVRGIRAALAYDAYTAKMSRVHNDANVLCLGSRTVTKDQDLAIRLARLWLRTIFPLANRHRRRKHKISLYEMGGTIKKNRHWPHRHAKRG